MKKPRLRTEPDAVAGTVERPGVAMIAQAPLTVKCQLDSMMQYLRQLWRVGNRFSSTMFPRFGGQGVKQ